MKRLAGLNEKPQHYYDDAPENIAQVMPNFRKMYIGAVGGGSAKGLEEALDLQQIVLKLRVTNESDYVDLEDAQIKLLTKKVEENTQNYSSFFLAQMFQKIKNAEEPPKKEAT